MPDVESGYISEPEEMMDDEEPEEDIFKEYDDEPEEDPEEDPEEEISKEYEEEPDEDPEEEIIKEYEEDPEEDLEEDGNEESGDEKLEMGNSHISSAVHGAGIGSEAFGSKLNDNPGEKRRKNMVGESKSESRIGNISTVNGEGASKQPEHSETSKTCTRSRWGTPRVDDTGKKRKTRWDENDSRNGLLNPSDFINHLGLWINPKCIGLRMKLDEINKKLRSSEDSDESPAGGRSPSPEPIYNNLGIRINTRVARSKMKLMNERKLILAQLVAANMDRHEPPKEKLVKKLFIPDKENPMYNFIGLILGPKGITQKKMKKETGAKIHIKGKGSGDPITQDENLHVLVEAAEQKALDSAVSMIEKLLIPMDDQINDHKKAQLLELAKMRGTYKDPNTCELCKEHGHRKYACPLLDSTFKAICCDLCGSIGHLTSNCDSVSGRIVDPANLYVSSLPPTVDDRRLREMFLPFGGIKSTKLVRNLATGLSKGFGFVKFENTSNAADAVKYMNGFKMDGRILNVRVAGVKPVANPLIQTTCSYGPTVPMIPQGPLFNPYNESFYFPAFSGYSGYNMNVTSSTEGVNIPPPYVVSSSTEPLVTSNVPSDFDFCDRIPSSVPNSARQFPGVPHYPGSELKSRFSSPAMIELQNQMMPENERNSSFRGGSGLP
ncbi:hypothetical protein OROGR_011077 [Orobanche gracilis]